MTSHLGIGARGIASLFCALALGACSRPGGPDSFTSGFPQTMATMPPPPAKKDTTCHTLTSSEPMPARSTVVSQMATGSATQTYFTSDLFGIFKSICGGCHVETSLGNFGVNTNTFSMLVDQKVLDVITSDDPNVFMPPVTGGGKPYSMRLPTDPVVQLATLLSTWLAQGQPDSFTLDSGGGDSTSDYAITPQLGTLLTNIGSCVPGKDMVAVNTDAMDALDVKFSQASALPATLAETDLVTLDSAELARNGVISYAPAYPLWADNAGKMRYVRVPRGQSISFDKDTQQFSIPPNTRFYKTFLKSVVDSDGNQSYRKIETRLIVSRAPKQLPDGSFQQMAVYGTYVWNADETEAVLLTDPLRSGQPFKDRVITYFTDELMAQQVIDSVGPDGNVDYALEVGHPGLARHYALPGSERCTECHMGSVSQSFILGFTPLQIARHPMGVDGVIEPAAGDELTQLDRLIAYGVVSGMTSSDDVLPLQQSQGTRKPRNDNELTAQAYMLGNCAHCHNPLGFPATKDPSLKMALNMMPSKDDGGIFQFPLDRFSPVRARGPNQSIPIPYITPSLRDYPEPFYPEPAFDETNLRIFFCKLTNGCLDESQTSLDWIAAPWRSLIYRNVDTPFDYVEDRTVFPHMPLNTPGYDCRAPRIMGNWMVSIPAVLAHPGRDENDRPFLSTSPPCPTCLYGTYPPDVDDDPQPYVEVSSDDPRYPNAVAAAAQRLQEYQTGYRYQFCPDTTDILDPYITQQVDANQQVVLDTQPVRDPNDPTKLIMPALPVPIRPHWVITDASDPPGDWFPRRVDWSTALVDHQITNTFLKGEDLEDLTDIVNALGGAHLDQATQTVLKQPVPFGIWKDKPQCMNALSQVPTADTYTGASRPAWMDLTGASSTDHVYSQTPGAAIFTTICFNCHGPQADSKGLLADEITLMTGGDARVANLRDGLFGPASAPGMNRSRVFGDAAAAAGATADDFAARYLAWMALGGTEKHLPQTILDQVSTAPVLGQYRGGKLELAGTPDMLRLGLKLCSEIALAQYGGNTMDLTTYLNGEPISWGNQTGLVDRNGDAEMWLRLCSLGNRPLVHGLGLNGTGGPLMLLSTLLYWGDNYPADQPVIDQNGKVTMGIQPDNVFPMCIVKSPQTSNVGSPTGGLLKGLIPFCPDQVTTSANQLQQTYDDNEQRQDYIDAKKWAARGAITAAMAVFVYLDDLAKGTKPQPTYDHCEQLPGASP
jgi:mono/diheme cytochrome c family protein